MEFTKEQIETRNTLAEQLFKYDWVLGVNLSLAFDGYSAEDQRVFISVDIPSLEFFNSDKIPDQINGIEVTESLALSSEAFDSESFAVSRLKPENKEKFYNGDYSVLIPIRQYFDPETPNDFDRDSLW
jgi:hypothetical protein